MTGPLAGVRILELAGIGPGPFCGMMLADLGADVIRIDRPGGNQSANLGHEVLFRSRRTVAVDLKHPEGVDVVLRLCEHADALYEGYRPGVAERLGVGPDDCLARNPALVYGRMTGWGQDGPLARAAGHDINYIALSGALHAIGRADSGPVPPLNLVGDFGGGGMVLAFGLVSGILAARSTGTGQVVDASMVEGSAALMAMFYGMRGKGVYSNQRGAGLLDTGAPFYDVYETADGRWISLGSIEPQFYAELLERLDLGEDFASQYDFPNWPAMKEGLAAVVRTRTRDEWDDLLAGTDVCYAPVLDVDEAPHHPHNQARASFVEVDGIVQHRPTPRFSVTTTDEPTPPVRVGVHTREVLVDSGFGTDEVDRLLDVGAVAEPPNPM
jgi:alpha-methylacyl-CoA racemase